MKNKRTFRKINFLFLLESTDLPFLGERYSGKVRDTYHKGDIRYLIATESIELLRQICDNYTVQRRSAYSTSSKGIPRLCGDCKEPLD